MTQERLAEKAGLSKGGIANLEQGLRAPAWETVQALAAALGVTCEAFQQEPGDVSPAKRGRPAKAAEEAPVKDVVKKAVRKKKKA